MRSPQHRCYSNEIKPKDPLISIYLKPKRRKSKSFKERLLAERSKCVEELLRELRSLEKQLEAKQFHLIEIKSALKELRAKPQ